ANTAAGSYYLLYVADPANLVAESNEANNVNYQYITVTAPFTGTIVPATGSASITTCSAAIYDNGGTGPYANSSSGSLTINPATANALVSLSFTAFGMEAGPDYLAVYDGPSTNATLLATYTGYSIPPTIVASNTNTSGALTLKFVSDGSVTGIGFVANANCVQRLATLPQQTAGYDVQVLPNPVAGGNALRVQLSGAGQPGAATLTLHNSLGQLVASRALTLASGRLNATELSTAGLATGVYVLRVSGTNLNVVRRVVVE
ncbi:MAG: T9SS type A sorting domain-containing protein, partial [Hymenobacter sp.]